MTSNNHEIEDKARLVAAAKKALDHGVLRGRFQERVQKALTRDAERQQASRALGYREITDNNTIALAAMQAHWHKLVPAERGLSDDVQRAMNAHMRMDRERRSARLQRDATRARQREARERGR